MSTLRERLERLLALATLRESEEGDSARQNEAAAAALALLRAVRQNGVKLRFELPGEARASSPPPRTTAPSWEDLRREAQRRADADKAQRDADTRRRAEEAKRAEDTRRERESERAEAERKAREERRRTHGYKPAGDGRDEPEPDQYAYPYEPGGARAAPPPPSEPPRSPPWGKGARTPPSASEGAYGYNPGYREPEPEPYTTSGERSDEFRQARHTRRQTSMPWEEDPRAEAPAEGSGWAAARASARGAKRITSLYGGCCAGCGGRIAQGERIWWKSGRYGSRIAHDACGREAVDRN